MQNTQKDVSSNWWTHTLPWLIAALFLSLGSFFLFNFSKANADDLSQLTTSGQNIEKNGNTFKIQGVNFGGLFETERYMNNTPFVDWKTMVDNNQNDATTWENNFWNQDSTNGDLANIKNLNANTVRLPFTYMNLIDYSKYQNNQNTKDLNDIWPDGGDNTAFAQLDNFIKKANDQGLYVVLDLHGAFGSQNGADHSGQELKDSSGNQYQNLYGNNTNQDLTKQLWQKIANHYKNWTGIAGYDLLNEPNSQNGSNSTTGSDQWGYYDQLLNTIRDTGDNHIAFIESVWYPEDLPDPSTYGTGTNDGRHWDANNVVYEYHKYPYNSTSSESSAMDWMKGQLNEIQQKNYDVPTYMGEFNIWDDNNDISNSDWNDFLSTMNSDNFSWTVWNYKSKADSGSNDHWGAYNEDEQHVSEGDTGYAEWSEFGSPQNLRKNDTVADAISDNSTPN